jgi:N-acetylneuraminic acid mutarotase
VAARRRGAQRFTATADWYAPHSQKIAVRPSTVVERDFRLPAGRLTVRPASLSSGGPATRTFTVTNTGTAPATVTFTERSVIGPVFSDGAGAPLTRVPGDFSPLALGRASGRGPRPVAGPAPWQTLPDLPTRIMDNTVAERGGTIYSIGGVDETGPLAAGWSYRAGAWTRIADLPEGREAPAGAFIGDTLYVNGGWGPNGRASGGTYAYDPGANAWRTVAPSPVWVAAAGRAVLGGKLYLVGGCTNACGITDVQRYDPATNTWERVADYPESTGHVACGAIDALLYCAGGTSRGTVSANTYAYDPAANTWTPRADLPIDLWGMGYTAASGQLLVAGGITGGAITNAAFAYDPAADTWRRLPASASLTYRGGSGCGLYRIGGSIRSGLNPSVTAELLPTYGDCAPVDVPWLSVGARTATLAPGRSLTVPVHLDAAAAGPGIHTGGVWIREDTPYLVAPVDVTLQLP